MANNNPATNNHSLSAADPLSNWQILSTTHMVGSRSHDSEAEDNGLTRPPTLARRDSLLLEGLPAFWVRSCGDSNEAHVLHTCCAKKPALRMWCEQFPAEMLRLYCPAGVCIYPLAILWAIAFTKASPTMLASINSPPAHMAWNGRPSALLVTIMHVGPSPF